MSRAREVQIHRFALRHDSPNKNGNIVLASFDTIICSLRFTGCVLVRRPDGSVRVSLPRVRSRFCPAGQTVVWIGDAKLRKKFADMAIAAYRALSGDDVVGDSEGDEDSEARSQSQVAA